MPSAEAWLKEIRKTRRVNLAAPVVSSDDIPEAKRPFAERLPFALRIVLFFLAFGLVIGGLIFGAESLRRQASQGVLVDPGAFATPEFAGPTFVAPGRGPGFVAPAIPGQQIRPPGLTAPPPAASSSPVINEFPLERLRILQVEPGLVAWSAADRVERRYVRLRGVINVLRHSTNPLPFNPDNLQFEILDVPSRAFRDTITPDPSQAIVDFSITVDAADLLAYQAAHPDLSAFTLVATLGSQWTETQIPFQSTWP